jgi:pyruvate-formate lyase-activating enzyme
VSAPKFQYSVEIVGACNLRCRSCPVGNSPADERPKGLMSIELFTAIIEKIARETPSSNTSVGLYDWGEPILHPEAPNFIRLIHSYGMRALVSSNLNQIKNIDAVVAAGPDVFTISVSGFTQDIYGRTHTGGDVKKVKLNMRTLRALMDAHGQNFQVIVSYHQYKENGGAEEEGMRALSEELGFDFVPTEAYLYPLEKRIAFIQATEAKDGKAPDPNDWLPPDTKLSTEDFSFSEWLLKPPHRQNQVLQVNEIDVSDGLLEKIRQEGPRYGQNFACYRITDKLSIRLDGSVGICCASFSPKIEVAKSFLDTPHAELQKLRLWHPFCGTCMRFGQGISVPLRL